MNKIFTYFFKKFHLRNVHEIVTWHTSYSILCVVFHIKHISVYAKPLNCNAYFYSCFHHLLFSMLRYISETFLLSKVKLLTILGISGIKFLLNVCTSNMLILLAMTACDSKLKDNNKKRKTLNEIYHSFPNGKIFLIICGKIFAKKMTLFHLYHIKYYNIMFPGRYIKWDISGDWSLFED